MVRTGLIVSISILCYNCSLGQKMKVDYEGFSSEIRNRAVKEIPSNYHFNGYFKAINQYGDTLNWYFFNDGTFYSYGHKSPTKDNCPIIEPYCTEVPYGWGFFKISEKSEVYVEYIWPHLKGLKFPVSKMYGYLQSDSTIVITKRFDPNMREMEELNWQLNLIPCENMPSSENMVKKGLKNYLENKEISNSK